MMKFYVYDEPSFNEFGDLVDSTDVIISEQEILDLYWTHWKSKMEIKFGKDSSKITEENCISDWIIVNYAKEVVS